MNCVIRDGRLQIQSKYQTSRTEVLTNWDSFIDEAGNTNGIVYFVQIGTCFTLRVVLDLTSADTMNIAQARFLVAVTLQSQRLLEAILQAC